MHNLEKKLRILTVTWFVTGVSIKHPPASSKEEREKKFRLLTAALDQEGLDQAERPKMGFFFSFDIEIQIGSFKKWCLWRID